MFNLKPFLKANSFVCDSFKSYYRFSTRSEKAVDLFGAFIFSWILIMIAILTNESLTMQAFLQKVSALNGVIITAVSILAGFNVASIALISSSNSDLVDFLKSATSEEDPDTNLFEILGIFFTWAIVVQLIIVLMGIVMYFITDFTIPARLMLLPLPYLVWIPLCIWVALIIHSFLISIRNIKMLYLFITSDKNKIESSES